jgi:hypothetical protein
MGKASSSKKVSRVARTGGGRTTRRSSGSWGFPLAMGVVVVLGVLGVVFSRDSAHHKAAADQPTVNDHWHAAYGFDVCGSFLPDLPQPPNLIGLHTHGDGVIHIEPQDAVNDTGKKATLGRFVSGYPGLKLSKNSFTILNQTWTNGEPKCDGKPGEVVVKSNGKVVTGDPTKLRVPKDGWITIAFVPKGADVPPPPNWEDKVKRANGGAGEHGKTPTTMPNSATPSSTPGATPGSTPGSTPASAPPASTPPGPPTTLR